MHRHACREDTHALKIHLKNGRVEKEKSSEKKVYTERFYAHMRTTDTLTGRHRPSATAVPFCLFEAGSHEAHGFNL